MVGAHALQLAALRVLSEGEGEREKRGRDCPLGLSLFSFSLCLPLQPARGAVVGLSHYAVGLCVSIEHYCERKRESEEA